MKKLKKGLSLLLVLAMVFSLASTALAWDTGYEDDDQITQKEAVEVLSNMGIIEGNNGKFDPAGQFTREQAAKIVTYMVLGPDTAESLQITANKFSDVSASRWSATYIAYAASQNIVMGDGNGKFRPADNVSRIEWLKMLLVSLGIDPDKNGLGDDPNWAANTQSLAVRSGLVTGKELALDWNRETAVLYAFNAMVLAQDSNWYQQNVYTGTNSEYKWIRQYAPTLYKVQEDDSTDIHSFTDEYGRSYTAWADSKKAKGATIYGKDYDEAVATYENVAVTYQTLSKDLGITGEEAVTYIRDGSAVTNTGTKPGTFKGDGALKADLSGSFGGRGSTVQIYKSGSTYKVVEINTYVAVVGTIGKDAKTVTLNKGETSEAIASVEGLAKGDIVSYNLGTAKTPSTVTAYNVTKLENATAITTEASGDDKGEAYIRQGETKYFASKNLQAASSVPTEINAASKIKAIGEANVYLDTYGNILYIAAGSKTVTKQPNGYVYVIEKQSKTSVEGLVNGTAAVAARKIVNLETGEVSTVTEAVVKAPNGSYYYANQWGTAGTTAVTASSSASNSQNDGGVEAVGSYVAYYLLDDGTYVFEDTINPSAYIDPTITKGSSSEVVLIEKGKAVVAETDDAYSTASTVLTTITVDHDKYTPTSVTGYANFPEIKESSTDDVTKMLVLKDKDKITNIYILNGSTTAGTAAADPNTYGMLTAIGEVTTTVDGVQTFNYTFKVNGEEKTYQYKEDQELDQDDVGTVFMIGAAPANKLTALTDQTYGYNETSNPTGSAKVVSVGDGYIVVKAAEKASKPEYSENAEVVYLMSGCRVEGLKPDSDELGVDSIVHIYKSQDSNHTGEAAYITVE